MNISTGRKWAVHRRRVSLFADGELESDDAMMCLAHRRSFWKLLPGSGHSRSCCCRRQEVGSRRRVHVCRWRAWSWWCDVSQQRCRSLFRHSWTDDHLKVMKRRWQCGQNWLLAVCLGYGVCASPGLGSDGGNVGLDMWPPGGGHHPCFEVIFSYLFNMWTKCSTNVHYLLTAVQIIVVFLHVFIERLKC